MAADIVALMDALVIPQAHILAHDRGGRVAYRLALDYPDRVMRLGIIEIVPTGDFWANWDATLAMKAIGRLRHGQGIKRWMCLIGLHWTAIAHKPATQRI